MRSRLPTQRPHLVLAEYHSVQREEIQVTAIDPVIFCPQTETYLRGIIELFQG